MRKPFARILLAATLVVVPAAFLLAQTSADPSGHWEGTVRIPEMELKIEVDLAKNSKGELAGIFATPTQGLKGFPLSTVTVEGRSVRFVLKADKEPSTFVGVVSADGKSISGEASQAGKSAPFSLTRTGEARIPPAPRNPPIGKEYEGTWNGTLDAGQGPIRLILKMANQPDGTAAGTIASPDGSGVEVPIGIAQKAANLTIEVPSVGASFAGVLNPAKTELAGTWIQGTQGSTGLPLTFRRTAAPDGKK